ncbi:MAG TPA: trehalose-6-phosphate synthase [Myxococcota bacterium]|nr:trehalose-6-phosphate synthase [Myxococcota bacterium]
MRRDTRFVIGLVVGLALLTWAAAVVVDRTTSAWFERDLAMRASLAVAGIRQGMISHLQNGERSRLRGLLSDLAHDERIMAVALCSTDAELLANTRDFPSQLSCAQVDASVRARNDGASDPWQAWMSITSLPGGSVHLSAIPLLDADVRRGFVVLVQDLSFVQRREGETRRFLVMAFGFLAVCASAVTIVAARLAWRGWTNEVRRFLRGGPQRAEFQPILKDVRELVDRIVADTEADRELGSWTPERLRHTLNRHLHGEKVVVVANREPYIHERSKDDGSIVIRHPASGLVTALEPVLRACSGTWIAHGSGSADRETADRHGRLRVPPGEESYSLRRIWLTPEEEQGYYYGFANEGLWPLCHITHVRPTFRSEDWTRYQIVNQKFADALCAEVDTEDPVVLVQDYHFARLPRLIRERLPRATVIMFWHIPWPNSQHFGICPWRKELIDGLLGASILGFHTQFDCNSFLDSVDRFVEARIDRDQNAVAQRGHTTLVRPYPISLEWPVHWVKTAPAAEECRARVFEEHKLGPDALLGLGVDRLDYTKGVEERLLAVERLLETSPAFVGRFTFLQLAAPSRTAIERYRLLNESVERLAARINDRFGRGDYRPVILLTAHHEPPTVYRYYRAADVCYVSSLHDGMNLVAKEFVAARDDEQGVLVLSQFAGAARELTEALIVNPYDLDEASAALGAALTMSRSEQRERMRSMRALISELNVYRWAGRMLVDATRLRSRDRLTGRLTDHLTMTSPSNS